MCTFGLSGLSCEALTSSGEGSSGEFPAEGGPGKSKPTTTKTTPTPPEMEWSSNPE